MEEHNTSETTDLHEDKNDAATDKSKEENDHLKKFLHITDLKHRNLPEIYDQIRDLIHTSNQRPSYLLEDVFNATSLAAQNLKGYLRLFSNDEIENLLEVTKEETSKFISSLFGIENGFMSFHDVQSHGLLRVCKLALYLKFSKYATDGFTALYTRPPVIYISAAAPANFGKNLRTQLGLPQSSICKVPCNTMFGSSYTMDIGAFERSLTDDVSCGKTPLIVIAYAGTPSTGHTDNLGRLREICTQSGVWLHLEGDSLATLALKRVPPSVSPAISADSMTLNLPNWFGSANLPYCTSYRTKNPSLAEGSGLVPMDVIDRLACLPFWMLIKSTGLDELRSIIINAVELAQQLSHRVDMVSGIKRIEQSNVTSPSVVFKYKASPTISYSSGNSLEDEEGDDSPSHPAAQVLGPKPSIDVSPKLCDALNEHLATMLQKSCEKVEIEAVTVSREGCCLLFSPLKSARAIGTNNGDVDMFIDDLEREIAKLDSTLIARSFFDDAFQALTELHIIDSSEAPTVGAFQCIPKYWQVKDMSNLSDTKKKEINDLNNNMFHQLSKEFDYLKEGKTGDGQIFIQIGVVDSSFDLNMLSERVKQLAEDLEDNSKFLESLSDAVQKSIHEAEAVLQRESEEKFFEEGVLRHVPLIGSVFSWLSPPPKESHGVTGRAFNLASGKLSSTEKTYKFKMQLQNDEDSEETAEDSTVKESSLNETAQDETSVGGLKQDVPEAEATETKEPTTEEETMRDVDIEVENPGGDVMEPVSLGEPDSHGKEAAEGEALSESNSNDNEVDSSSDSNEIGEEVKESDV